MSKPKKTQATQKKKIKQLKAHVRSAIQMVYQLKQRNRALQRNKRPSRTFKYYPRIIRILDVKTVHRFSRRPLEIRLKSHPRPLTLNPLNPPPLDHFSNTHFQSRLKSLPPPQITQPPELTEFHYFPYLPFEIRVPIWKLAVDTALGRDIILRVEPLDWGYFCALELAEISSSTKIPALLHTCHVSRRLALERWELCMSAYDRGVGKVYVDAETDSIFFPCLTTLWHWQGKGNEGEVRKISAERKVFVAQEGDVVKWSDFEPVPPRNGWFERAKWIGGLDWGAGW